MGIQRWTCLGLEVGISDIEGNLVLFTDHERVVGELKEHIRLSAISALELDAQNRKELAASRAELEGLRAGIVKALDEIEDDGPKAMKYAAQELRAAMEKGNDPAKA